MILKRSTNDSNFLENVMQYHFSWIGQGTYVLSSLWAGESGKGGEKSRPYGQDVTRDNPSGISTFISSLNDR